MKNERIEKYELLCDMVKKEVDQLGVEEASKKIEQMLKQGQPYGSLSNQEVKELLKEIPICAFAKQFYCLSKSVETMTKEQQTSFYVTHLIQAIQETCLHLYEEGYSLEEIHHHVEGSIGAVSPSIKRFECITRKYDFRSVLKQEVENMDQESYMNEIKNFLLQMNYEVSTNEKAIYDLADYITATLIFV